MPARRHAPTRTGHLDLPLTRRRALALGAAAGLGTLVTAPAVGWGAVARGTRSFGMDVEASDWARGGGRRTGVLVAPRRFNLLGLRGRGLASAGVEVRVRPRGGPWSPWAPFGLGADHAPDRPRSTSIPTDPVWAGAADELQLRARRAPSGLRVHFVGLPPGPAARAAASYRPRQAAAGSAPAIVPRVQWGGDKVAPREAPKYGEVQMAFVHHTVSANAYGPQDSAGIVLAIAKYHRDTNGWNDIGYNLLVDQFGQVFEGRAGGLDLAVIGAQAQGWNAKSTGIATIGTFSDVPFPAAGVDALARTIAYKLSLHGVPVVGEVVVQSAGGSQNRYPAGALITFERISGHRDGCSTSCPGNGLYAQLDDVRARAATLASGMAGTPKLTVAPAAAAVAYGELAAFSGVLAGADGGPLSGAEVVLQKQGSRSKYVTIARTRSEADGSWRVATPWKRSAAVRAVATVAGRTRPVRSSPVTVAVTPVLTVAALSRRVLAGRAFTVGGTIRPGAPVFVRVEREVRPGVWVKSADVPLRVRGTTYAGAVTLRRPGLHRLSVRTRGADGAAGSGVRTPVVVVRAVRRAADVRTGGATAG